MDSPLLMQTMLRKVGKASCKMWFDYDAKCNIEYGIYLIGQSGDDGECMTKHFWHRSKKHPKIIKY